MRGRPMMRSPGRPGCSREVERRFWLVIAIGASTDDSAAACGVAPASVVSSVPAIWWHVAGSPPPGGHACRGGAPGTNGALGPAPQPSA